MREKIVIYGINKNPEDLFETLKEKYEIVGWVDSNENYQHQYINDLYVYSPMEMRGLTFDKVIIGAAIFGGTRSIMKTCEENGVSKENVISSYVLKNAEMNVRDIIRMQYKEGTYSSFETFIRINLLIQYAFIKQYFEGEGRGIELAKVYMQTVCNEERGIEHEIYFKELINKLEENKELDGYVSLNRQGELIDGTHRLAYYIYMGSEKVKVDVFNTIWNVSKGGKRDLEWIKEYISSMDSQDIAYLHDIYREICEKYHIGNEYIEGKSDIW